MTTAYHYYSSTHSNGRLPLSPARNPPIHIFTQKPLPSYGWLTSIEPVLVGLGPFDRKVSLLAWIKEDRYFLLGSAATHTAGLWAFCTNSQRLVRCQGLAKAKIWDLCSVANRVALVSDGGKVSLGILHASEEESLRLTESTILDGQSLKDQVRQVQLFPHQEDLLALGTRSAVHLCSLHTRCTQKIKGTSGIQDEIASFRISPHDTHLIALAESTGTLDILDCRLGESQLAISLGSYKCPLPIGNLQWSPFLPYWLMAGDDEGLAVYDLRYVKRPAQTLDSPLSSAFCWSRSNCELLMVGSADRTASLWSLLQGGKQLYTVPHDNLFSSQHELNVFYGLTLLGALIRLQVDSDSIKALVPHEYALGGLGHEIETKLYCREFRQVYECLLEHSNNATSNEFGDLQRLTSRTMPAPSISPDSWHVGEETDGEFRKYHQNIEFYSRNCPPGFDMAAFDAQNATLKDAVDCVRLKMKILELVEQAQVPSLLSLQSEILEAMGRNNAFLKSEILIKILALLMRVDRLAALCFGRKIIELMPNRLDNGMCALIHALLFPTIFDAEAAVMVQSNLPTRAKASSIPNTTNSIPLPPSSPSKNGGTRDETSSSLIMIPPIPEAEPNAARTIRWQSRHLDYDHNSITSKIISQMRRTLRSVKHAFAMIDLEMYHSPPIPSMLTFAWNSALLEIGENETEKGRQLVAEQVQQGTSTISAMIVWNHLEYLLERSMLEAYFTSLGKLCSAPVTPFGHALLEYLDRQVMPKLKYVLVQAIETHRPSLVVRAILLIVTLVDGVRPLPQAIEAFLLDRLCKLTRAAAFHDYRHLAGFHTLRAHLTAMVIPSQGRSEIWREMTRLRAWLAPLGSKTAV